MVQERSILCGTPRSIINHPVHPPLSVEVVVMMAMMRTISNDIGVSLMINVKVMTGGDEARTLEIQYHHMEVQDKVQVKVQGVLPLVVMIHMVMVMEVLGAFPLAIFLDNIYVMLRVAMTNISTLGSLKLNVLEVMEDTLKASSDQGGE